MAERTLVPWMKVPCFLLDEGLSPYSILTFAVLLHKARGTGTVKIGFRRLAKTLGASLPTVERSLLSLEAHGLIAIARGQSGASNTYTMAISQDESANGECALRRKQAPTKRVHEAPTESVQGANGECALAPTERGRKTRKTEYRKDRGESAPAKDRARDPIWDVVVELWFSDGIPEQQRSRVGQWVQTLKDLGATADEIRVRHKRAIEWYERKRATLKCTVEHWSDLKHDSSTGTSRPGRVEPSGDDFPPAFKLTGG